MDCGKVKKKTYIKVRVLRNTKILTNDGTIDFFEDVAELDVEQRKFKNRRNHKG